MLDKLGTLSTLERGGLTMSTFWKSKEKKERIKEDMMSHKNEWQAEVVNSRLHFQIVTMHLLAVVQPFV